MEEVEVVDEEKEEPDDTSRAGMEGTLSCNKLDGSGAAAAAAIFGMTNRLRGAPSLISICAMLRKLICGMQLAETKNCKKTVLASDKLSILRLRASSEHVIGIGV